MQAEQAVDFLRVAQAAVEAALDEARSRGIRVAAVVIDRSFTPAAAQRMDDSFASTFVVAQAKAHTALNFLAPTAAMAARVRPENQASLQRLMPDLLFVGGGLPIRVGEHVVGAVGVSGGSEADDIDCAQAAVEQAERLLLA